MWPGEFLLNSPWSKMSPQILLEFSEHRKYLLSNKNNYQSLLKRKTKNKSSFLLWAEPSPKSFPPPSLFPSPSLPWAALPPSPAHSLLLPLSPGHLSLLSSWAGRPAQASSPRRPRLRAAATGCPRRLLARPGRRRRRPLVVPGCRGVRPSVEPFSSVVRVRQASRGSPVVVFVLGSASSSLVPAASRLRPRIAAEVVPSPFASVVPEPSPPRSFVVVVPTPRRVVACSFACVLRVASVVPEVPEAWFAVVAEGSEGRSL
uniref:Cell wall protein-like n=1 Tax=Oryza sativa subsp. japonica TaxID=39947 RepID=Q6ESX8_ORYSJ|nr:cell wall protein-like [Oryza sativa Japonica Group]